MRVRFVVTIAVGVALIFAGAVETDIHHKTHTRGSRIEKASVPNPALLNNQ